MRWSDSTGERSRDLSGITSRKLETTNSVTENKMQTVTCMKWGTRYPSDYVNRLWSMIRRNTVRPTRLICFTDDSSGVSEDVICHPLPAINIPERESWSPWRKLSLWQVPLADLSGDVLFLDLDMVITGNIDCFFDYEPGWFCVIENWTQLGKGIGNTSLYRFPVGRYSYIFDDFHRDPEAVLSRYRIEQQYISDVVDDMKFWPPQWCVSFKHALVPRWPMNFFKTPELPDDARVIAFTGKPDPDEAAAGKWPVSAAWKAIYKHVRPASWISEHWQ